MPRVRLDDLILTVGVVGAGRDCSDEGVVFVAPLQEEMIVVCGDHILCPRAELEEVGWMLSAVPRNKPRCWGGLPRC